MKKLKRCPFCGGKAQYCFASLPQYEGGQYIECTQCGATTNLTYPIKDSVEDIVCEKWNTRVKP